MTPIGIDFGTSNCTAFVVAPDGRVVGIPLEDGRPVMPSVLFTTRGDADGHGIDVAEFERRLARAREAAGGSVTDAELRRRVADAMRDDAARAAAGEHGDAAAATPLSGGRLLLHGTPALRAYLADPLGGTLIRSPKSFLGSNLSDDHLDVFEEATARILRRVRQQAARVLGVEPDAAVIGRPARFHGNRGDAGDRQALALIERAARDAGFARVRFVLEPVAAAMSYERTLVDERVVLVLDVGGGTTDCAVVRVGPGRAPHADREHDVLGWSGDRIGGTDVDQSLAWSAFMPAFGKGTLLKSGLPFPHPLLIDAISTRDVPAQLRFARAGAELARLVGDAQSPALAQRLLAVHRGRLQHRLLRSAELAKIALSDARACEVSLDYVEAGLRIDVGRDALADAARAELDRIGTLVAEAIAMAGVRPDALFVTGGMGLSPIVLARIRETVPDLRIETGDMLVSVGQGLALCAARAPAAP